MRRLLRLVGAPFALSVLLAGCATTTEPEEPAPPPVAAEPETEAPPSLPADPVIVPAPRVFDADVFSGLDGDTLEARHGSPAFRRSEGSAQVWQYVAGDCVLNIFLYADDASPPVFRVDHVDAKVRSAAQEQGVTPADACAGPFGTVQEAGPENDTGDP